MNVDPLKIRLLWQIYYFRYEYIMFRKKYIRDKIDCGFLLKIIA